MQLTIQHLAFHRNGMCGAPFHAIVFRDEGPEATLKLAVVFREPDHTAVFDLAKLAAGDVAFGSNSWRGDRYEADLRAAIQQTNV